MRREKPLNTQSATIAEIAAAIASRQPLVASLYRRGKLPHGCELSLVDGQELECEILPWDESLTQIPITACKDGSDFATVSRPITRR